MHCFYHPEQPAVALCSVCSKGICSACAADLRRSTACRDKCEVESRRLLDLRDYSLNMPHLNENARATIRKNTTRSGIVSLFMGVLSFGFGVYVLRIRSDAFSWYLIGFGAILIVSGALTWATRGFRSPSHFRICTRCGYNLTGNTTGSCPECGQKA